ncbi:MAG: fimbria/pilus periplasmic chaperone [Hyphomonadaceae bacterium]
MLRALIVAATFFMAQNAASAQTGGIRVAPVLVSLTPERAIGSIRLTNGRDTPVSFEVEAYVWSQANGEDQLIPTNTLIVAPAIFEIRAGSEQTVRLGVRDADPTHESAYRILLRELPAERQSGAALGFALEMSLPVFVTPRGAAADITTHVDGQRLTLTNTGNSFAQIALLSGEQRLDAPRYLLAGSSATIEISTRGGPLRLVEASALGQRNEHVIHVGPPVQHASVH